MSYTILGMSCKKRWCRLKAILCVLRGEALIYATVVEKPDSIGEGVNLIHVDLELPNMMHRW